MILPLRVFGSSCVNVRYFGVVNFPSLSPTCLRSSSASAGEPSKPPRSETKQQIAFYASTPAYRPVLEVEGWADLPPELRTLSKSGRWDEMPALIDDTLLGTIAAVHDYGGGPSLEISPGALIVPFTKRAVPVVDVAVSNPMSWSKK